MSISQIFMESNPLYLILVLLTAVLIFALGMSGSCLCCSHCHMIARNETTLESFEEGEENIYKQPSMIENAKIVMGKNILCWWNPFAHPTVPFDGLEQLLSSTAGLRHDHEHSDGLNQPLSSSESPQSIVSLDLPDDHFTSSNPSSLNSESSISPSTFPSSSSSSSSSSMANHSTYESSMATGNTVSVDANSTYSPISLKSSQKSEVQTTGNRGIGETSNYSPSESSSSASTSSLFPPVQQSHHAVVQSGVDDADKFDTTLQHNQSA
eukprot:MONOS_2099.2-p1 / transcript=MONOS_2099.2 / gene=MONOS_2099 / organism=Monocercomonoides_exilis_PA203 / gene_product=unspecified product / transcript_product=unspecified product / location=Mono_scaffold00041:68660-69648(+) / protein_length=267 / sequence_SO=supercontig / SO=protein_coding / is_pseudo=false